MDRTRQMRVDGEVVARARRARAAPASRSASTKKARARRQAQRVTVLLNKPVGVSGQAEDGYEPVLVLVKRRHQWREDASSLRLQREHHLRHLCRPARLDIDLTGLLVLTQVTAASPSS